MRARARVRGLELKDIGDSFKPTYRPVVGNFLDNPSGMVRENEKERKRKYHLRPNADPGMRASRSKLSWAHATCARPYTPEHNSVLK